MRKLTKDQRLVLKSCVESFDAHGVDKPITVMPLAWRERIKEFAPSYARYCAQMFKLEDDGLIARRAELSYAYVTDYARARAVLAAN